VIVWYVSARNGEANDNIRKPVPANNW